MEMECKRVAILVDQGFKDLEFWVPQMRLIEEGATVTIVGPEVE